MLTCTSNKVIYRCANECCPYGPDWDAGKPDAYDNGPRPEHARAEAYSQDPAYRKDGNMPFKGYCLNCYDDWDKDCKDAEDYYP